MHYKHLTAVQRRKIAQLRRSGKSESQIASSIGVDKSTVCRETSRNSVSDNYEAVAAEKMAARRRELSKK